MKTQILVLVECRSFLILSVFQIIAKLVLSSTYKTYMQMQARFRYVETCSLWNLKNITFDT